MNIREVIEKLHKVAAQLPDGVDSEVQVHICNGDDPGLMTPSIEVDTMWTQNEQTLALSGRFAIVQGHPHRDEGDSTTRPVTAEIDDLVEKWAADQRGVEGGAGRSDLIRLSSDKDEYVLVPLPDGKFVRFTLADDKLQFLPGSPDAVAAGCVCDPRRNNYGRGYLRDDGVQMVIAQHGQLGGPAHQPWNALRRVGAHGPSLPYNPGAGKVRNHRWQPWGTNGTMKSRMEWWPSRRCR